jgi:hypothetical protein
VLTLVVLACFARFLSADYASSDWWPVLGTNSLESPSDLVRAFLEPAAAGDPAYLAATAPTYRPLSIVSYALDYKVWGLDRPWGFQLTNLLAHLGVVVATYALARQLGLKRWASVLAALAFTLHPAIVATEPAIGRRLDVLSALFLLCSLLLLLRGGGWELVGASVLFAVSLLVKETSLVGAALAVPVLALARRPVWRVAWLLPPVAIAVGARVLVLGSLGGYGTAAAPSVALLPEYRVPLVHYLADFVAPGPPLGTYLEMSLQITVALVLVLGAAAVCPPRQRGVVLLGLLWFFSYALLYAWLRVYWGAWYLYQPLIGFGLCVGALADGGAERFPSRRAMPALGLALTAGLLLLRSSPLITPYPEWFDMSARVRSYLADVDMCREDGDPPSGTDRRGPYADIVAATGLADYSVRGYLALRYPTGERPCAEGKHMEPSTS